jgi:hypothetical protein
MGLERGPLSLVCTIDEVHERKSSGFSLENRQYGRRNITLTTWHPLSANIGTNFADNCWSLGQYSSLVDSDHWAFILEVVFCKGAQHRLWFCFDHLKCVKIAAFQKSRVDGGRQSRCFRPKITYWKRKCETVRCLDATSSCFVAILGGEVFAGLPGIDSWLSIQSSFTLASESCRSHCAAHMADSQHPVQPCSTIWILSHPRFIDSWLNIQCSLALASESSCTHCTSYIADSTSNAALL